MKKIRVLFAALCIAAAAPALAQTDISGTWSGMLAAGPDTTIEIHFVLTREGDGYKAVLTSPNTGAIQDVAATSTSFADNRLVLAVDALSGRYEGVLENGKFAGNWMQQGTAIPLELVPFAERALSEEAKAALRGSWVGPLTVPQANVTLAIVFRFEDAADGSFAAFLDSPDEGARGIPISNVALADGRLSLAIPRAVVEFTANFDGETIDGTWRQLGQVLPLRMSRGEYQARGLELSSEAIDRLEGSWVGRVQNAAGGSLAIVFRFERTGAGNVVAYLDSPEQGASNIPMSEIKLEGDELSLVVPAAQASFRATLSADAMNGTWAQGNMSQAVTMARGEYTPTVAALDLDDAAWARLAGTWRGPMNDLEVVVRFETTAEGARVASFDVPARGASGIAIAAASLTGDALELSVPAGNLTIVGTLSGETITAEWRQGATNNPLSLTRQP